MGFEPLDDGGLVADAELTEGPGEGFDDQVLAGVDEEIADGERARGVAGAEVVLVERDG